MGRFAGNLGTSVVALGALVGAVACGAGASPSVSKSASEPPRAEYAPADAAAESQAAPAPTAGSDGASGVGGRFREGEVVQPERTRPGLGTEWGETRTSRITTSPFVRGDSVPFAMASLFYNDDAGARAMASANGSNARSDGRVDIGNGVASVALKDGSSGRFFSGFEASGKEFIIGEVGARYSIVVTNNVPARLEVVVSVDGLDVLDGKSAATAKRGYLIEPNGTLEIDGFRQSTESVAAFRFGSVSESYASKKHGETRNVGVIGVALFNEQGSNPRLWNRGEVDRRFDANPFPGTFATPPSN